MIPENAYRGWQPDIFGIHELRFYADDGKPTMLVSDAGTKSHDPPPLPGTWQPSALAQATPANRSSGSTFEFAPNLEPRAASTPGQATASRAPALYELAMSQYERSAQSVGTPTRIAYAVILCVMLVSGVVIAVDHLSGKNVSPPRSTETSTSVVSTTTPTMAQAIPAELSPSAAGSAATLVSNWAAGNRSAALAVATPAAVATLFSVPYPSGLAIARGCSVAFSPIVCTYGPPGGASPDDRIFEIDVSKAADGWYVSAVRVEN